MKKKSYAKLETYSLYVHTYLADSESDGSSNSSKVAVYGNTH